MKAFVISAVAAACIMATGSAMSADMPPEAKKAGCTSCHSIDKKLVGPAWMDVSQKYKGAAKFSFKGKEYPLVEGLMMKVSQGGGGNWGAIPMIANDPKGKKQDDIKKLVEFILGLAK